MIFNLKDLLDNDGIFILFLGKLGFKVRDAGRKLLAKRRGINGILIWHSYLLLYRLMHLSIYGENVNQERLVEIQRNIMTKLCIVKLECRAEI